MLEVFLQFDSPLEKEMEVYNKKLKYKQNE